MLPWGLISVHLATAGNADETNAQPADKPPLQPSLVNGASLAPSDLRVLTRRSCWPISILYHLKGGIPGGIGKPMASDDVVGNVERVGLVVL